MSKVTGFGQHPTSSGMGIVHIALLDCGHEAYAGYFQTFPADVIIGSELPCGQCKTIAEQIAWLEALDPKVVHHVRYRPRFGGTYTFYKLDVTSPSGFFSIGGTYATPEIDAILQHKGLSPISPTEQA
jgi:hypothetical protein